MTNTGKPKRKKALLLGGIALVLVIGIVFLLWARPWVEPDSIKDWSTPPEDRQITTILSADGHITMAYELPNELNAAIMRLVPYTCFIRSSIDGRMELYNSFTDDEYDNIVFNKWVVDIYEWDDPAKLIKEVDIKKILDEQLPEYQPWSGSVTVGIYEGEVSVAIDIQPKYNRVRFLERPPELRNSYTSRERKKSELPIAVIKLESEEAVLAPSNTQLSVDIDLGGRQQDYSMLNLLDNALYAGEKGLPGRIISQGEPISQYGMVLFRGPRSFGNRWIGLNLPIYDVFPEIYQLVQEDVEDVYFLFDSTVTPEEIMQLFMPEGVSWEPEGDYDY